VASHVAGGDRRWIGSGCHCSDEPTGPPLSWSIGRTAPGGRESASVPSRKSRQRLVGPLRRRRCCISSKYERSIPSSARLASAEHGSPIRYRDLRDGTLGSDARGAYAAFQRVRCVQSCVRRPR
jgi:hypothetical protein